MEVHAKINNTIEVCGLLSGLYTAQGNITIDGFIPLDNQANAAALATPFPEAQLAATNQIFQNDKHNVGWFHSHPHNLGIPSNIDFNEAEKGHLNYLWAIYGGKDRLIRYNYWNGRSFERMEVTECQSRQELLELLALEESDHIFADI